MDIKSTFEKIVDKAYKDDGKFFLEYVVNSLCDIYGVESDLQTGIIGKKIAEDLNADMRASFRRFVGFEPERRGK